MDFDLLLRVVRALNEHGVEYVVVGAIALALHGLVRATADLDLFVAPGEQNTARLRAALGSVFDDAEIASITAADLEGDYATIQYVPPTGAFHIDLLARLGDAFEFSEIEFQEIDVDGTSVRVATPRMLYRMKKDTVRLQDAADAERLRRAFDLEDEDAS